MKRTTKLLAGGIVSIGFIASSYGVAGAATPATVPTGWFTGSIPWDGSTGAALIALATVTPAQADADAVAAVPGTAGTAQVIHDHGYVVYRTLVTTAAGSTVEVIVDAGDGTILDQYAPIAWDGTVPPAPGSLIAPPPAAATVPTGWFTGSIAWDGSTGAALVAMATVTPDQANAAAVAAVPGTAGMPEVIHDHGSVVYRTIVTKADGTQVEVIVDAGSAAVLDQYAPLWNGSTAPTATATATATATPAAATVPTGFFTGSIAANGTTGAALRALATVSPDQANAAATAAVPGTAGTPEVIHDHGFVVYRTIVTQADGSQVEVIVDAGNASVLDQYTPLWDGVTL